MIFTRQEVLLLTGLTRSQLTYLDKIELVVPEKIGNPKKPYCHYSWKQLIMLMAYSKLREDVSLQQLKDVFVDMRDVHPFHLFWHKKIVLTPNHVYWVEPDDLMEKISEILTPGKPIKIHLFKFRIFDLIAELRQNALDNNVQFFEDRLQKGIDSSKVA